MDLKTIRLDILRYLAKQSDSVLLDDCIALIIVEILGYINSKNETEFGKWSSICSGITNYKKLSKEGLLVKIKTEVLNTMTTDEKRELLENKAIYEFHDDALVFSTLQLNTSKYATVKLRGNYGSESYIQKIVKVKVNGLVSLNKQNKKIENLNDVLSQEETALNIFWNQLETDERKKLFPFWKWKINTTEFDELEKKIIALSDKFNPKDVVNRHSFKIALYFSEWYKRVYNGNDSKKNIIIDSFDSKSIWDNIDKEFITGNYLYTINKSERATDSLRLLGGLPLTYITSDDKKSNLSFKFSKLFRDINSDKTLNLEDLGLNNQSMNKSSQNGGSIYEFIIELLDGRFPFADSDFQSSPFREFKSLVEGGLKEYKIEKKKKFTVSWFVKQHSTFEYIYPYLHIKLKPGDNNENHRFIDIDRLSEWGILESISHFEIIVRVNFQEGSKDVTGYFFNKCANGKFISRSGEIWKIGLDDLPQKPISVEFILKTEALEKSIQKQEMPNYVQLWDIGFGEWQSRAVNGKRSAVLLLNEETCTKQTELSKEWETKNKTEKYRWAVINKELILIDKSKEKILYQKDGCIEVTPKNLMPFSNAINYYEDGKVKYIQNECEKYVYLLKGNVEFSVYYIPKSIFRNKNNVVVKKDFIVEYKTPKMDKFEKYESNTDLQQGIVKFKVSEEPYSEIIECYWLPENATINRDVHIKRITFKEIDVIGLSNNQYIDKEENMDKNYIPVKIGDEDNYVELDIYRALNRPNDLLVNEKYETTIDLIPIKFADNFTIRVIDSKCVELHRLSEKLDKFRKIEIIYNNNKTKKKQIEDKTGIPNAPQLPCIQTYTKNTEISKINGFYSIANRGGKSLSDFEMYKFYFLALKTNRIEPINLEEDDMKNTIGFQLNNDTDGIVFQSLQSTIYQETYRPFFVSSTDTKFHVSVKREDRANRIASYKVEYDFQLAITHFNIAIKHKLYFGMFDILWALEDSPTLLAAFYLEYYSTMKDSEINYKELYRFAEEMLFDWMLIPRKVWIDVIAQKRINEKQRWISSLFRQKHVSIGSEKFALSQYSEKCWESKHDKQNNKNILYVNIKRVKKIDAYFKLDTKSKIDILRTIDQSSDIYTTLLETL